LAASLAVNKGTTQSPRDAPAQPTASIVSKSTASADPAGRTTPTLPVIGLTGGIASGKSTVARLLAERGAHVIDADRVGHSVLEPTGEAYPEVVTAFGPEILDEDGTVSRPKLGAIVFADPARRAQLNGISHPRMAERMGREIEKQRLRRGGRRPPVIVLDAAILFEAGWDALCDTVWTVEAPPELAIARLMQRNGLERAQAEARLAAQLSNAERARRAARVIRNEGSLAALEAEVARLWVEVVPAA
jgi:dephospho-CoA kinase